MEKGQKVYVTVYCTSDYSDYLEQVVGITNSKEQALVFAKQMADYVNSQKDWWFNDDRIVIREYRWNDFQINTSEAHRNLYDMSDAQENKVEEVKVYKDAYESRSNGSICHERLVPVEEEK